jgi:chromosomal replication initiation ATPase DnaA
MIQEVFEFPKISSYELDDFIVTDSNSLSFHKITNWPQSWTNSAYPYFLMLYGDKKCGKTHLANIWQTLSNASFITGPNLDSIQQYGNLIIEDIDDKRWSEKDLLHIFNLCHETKRYCLFTSTIFPLEFSLADLSSRIKSIDRISIGKPDKETVKIILRKEFSKRSLQIEQKLIDFLSDVIPLNFESAYKAVEILNSTALINSEKINLSLIKKIFLTRE